MQLLLILHPPCARCRLCWLRLCFALSCFLITQGAATDLGPHPDANPSVTPADRHPRHPALRA
jgi:hypothetical protein